MWVLGTVFLAGSALQFWRQRRAKPLDPMDPEMFRRSLRYRWARANALSRRHALALRWPYLLFGLVCFAIAIWG